MRKLTCRYSQSQLTLIHYSNFFPPLHYSLRFSTPLAKLCPLLYSLLTKLCLLEALSTPESEAVPTEYLFNSEGEVVCTGNFINSLAVSTGSFIKCLYCLLVKQCELEASSQTKLKKEDKSSKREDKSSTKEFLVSPILECLRVYVSLA